tara:strand:- start:861 stop:992 length:132 start_codon:yes stop_codon:yes gene_type:complete
MKELQKEKNKSSVGNGLFLIITLGLFFMFIVAAFSLAFINIEK